MSTTSAVLTVLGGLSLTGVIVALSIESECCPAFKGQRLLGCFMCPSNLRLEATGHGTREARTFPVLGMGVAFANVGKIFLYCLEIFFTV